ncbi:MAG: ankyrin repeat domain-containing protein [Treponema sp.]|jgi:ankyrin repeat protein|nr:ankyrin repeat domain-containing protein [Treponema sp.]
MKRKMIFGIMVVFLFFVQAQTVFAEDYNDEFAKKFAANDMSGIETLLREHGHQMDLQTCLSSVGHSLAWITLGKNPYDLMETALPLNRNRNSIFKAIQLLVANGVDLNQDKHKGLITGNAGGSLTYYFGNALFSNVLYWSIRGNSQPNMAIIRFLLESGADPNSEVDMYAPPRDILFMAIGQGNATLVKLLVDAGCKVDQYEYLGGRLDKIPQDKYIGDLSALQFATYFGEYAIVRTLVEAGAKINYTDTSSKTVLASKTAAVIARERGETDIYNYLQSSQVASAPPSSSQQPRSTYNDDYTPPPSSSSSSSTPDRNIGREIAEAFRSPLQSGTYALAGTQARIRLTSIARSGIFTYTNRQGRTGTGNYSIDGNRMTIQMEGYTFLYTVTSETSFSGSGENWVRTGY